MVPGPAFSRRVQAPNSLNSPLAPGDHVVVLASGASVRDKESTVACVRKSLVDEMPGVQLVPAAEFREAVRASRWPFGESEEDARRIMADPIVRDAIARLGVRYAIGVSTITTED